ncbi:MAG: TlpA family protein disulfide reductase [Anaerolineae bacterium]|nr:TlpA family protein disulfide reductase [Anaerolineae bacterium]
MEQTLSQPKQSTAGRNILLVVGILLLLGLMAIMAINLQKVESVDLKDRKAPDFSLPLFDQFEQDQLALADLRGKVVVVNFWASWCVECYKEAALLEQAWQDYKDRGVMFVGVDYLDTDKEGLAYMAKYGITYPSGPDLGSKISKDYAITGVPETFFIDQEGNIAHVQIGPIERDQLYGLLDRLVTQPTQGS